MQDVTTDGTLDQRRVQAMAAMLKGEPFEWTVLQIPIKCMNCSLHYTIWTENPNWIEQHKGGYCPECGAWNGGKLYWQRERQGTFVYLLHQEDVPQESEGFIPAPTVSFGTAGRGTGSNEQ